MMVWVTYSSESLGPCRESTLFFFLGIQLIYNVVLISAVQQHDSVIHIIIFHIFSIVVYHRILNIYPCAIQ